MLHIPVVVIDAQQNRRVGTVIVLVAFKAAAVAVSLIDKRVGTCQSVVGCRVLLKKFWSNANVYHANNEPCQQTSKVGGVACLGCQ